MVYFKTQSVGLKSLSEHEIRNQIRGGLITLRSKNSRCWFRCNVDFQFSGVHFIQSVIMGCCYLGDEDISHVPCGDDQCRSQAAGGGASGRPREGCVGEQWRGGACVRPANRRAPPETQRRPQDGEDEREGMGCI